MLCLYRDSKSPGNAVRVRYNVESQQTETETRKMKGDLGVGRKEFLPRNLWPGKMTIMIIMMRLGVIIP